MLIFDPSGGSSILLGSCIFYGFRFNIADEKVEFDYDNYLANKEDAEKLLNCRIVPINMSTGEYAISLVDCFSLQATVPPEFFVTRKFKTRNIEEKDIENLKEFAKFFGIPYSKPEWRHCLSKSVISIVPTAAEGREPESKNSEAVGEEQISYDVPPEDDAPEIS